MACGGCLRIREAVLVRIRPFLRKSEPEAPKLAEAPKPSEKVLAHNVRWPLSRAERQRIERNNG